MKIESGEYCKVYGDTIENQILEYLLESRGLDFAVGDIARFLEISRPKTYSVFNEFLKKNYVVKSRVIGKTQLYKLNTENPVVKIFLRNFKECLQMVLDRYKTKKPGRNTSMSNVGIVSARSI